MRSGHGRDSGTWLRFQGRRCAAAVGFASALLVALHTSSPANAQPASAYVVGIEPHDPELVARVSGQTRDLPLNLQWVEASMGRPPSEAQLASAARRHAADLVVAITRRNDGYSVYVYDAQQRVLRTRQAPRPARERLSSSAAVETVALIVRGELLAALASQRDAARLASQHEAQTSDREVSGTPTTKTENAGSTPRTAAPAAPIEPRPTTPTRPEPPPPAAENTPEPVDTPQPSAAEESPQLVDLPQPSAAGSSAGSWAGPVRLAIAVGMRAAVPISDQAFASPALALRLAVSHLGLEIWGNTSLVAHLEQKDLSVALRRHGLGANLFASFAPARTLEITVGPGLGLVLYQRETGSNAAWVSTTDHTLSSIIVTTSLAAHWHFSQKLGLSVEVGLDVLLRPPRFVYRQDPDTERTLARVARTEPWGLLALFVEFSE